MRIDELVKQIAIPLIIALAVGAFTVLYNAGTQKVLLEQNIIATAKLTESVIELRIQMAGDKERYVTKDDLERRLMVERR